jgi:hypothetical protein
MVNNSSKWQMGFNLAFKELIFLYLLDPNIKEKRCLNLVTSSVTSH